MDRRQQLRLRRRIALNILERFPISCESITLFEHEVNTIYRVTGDLHSAGKKAGSKSDTLEKGDRFALKIYGPGMDQAPIQSELEWVAHLHFEASVAVPKPIESLEGSFVRDGGVSEGSHAPFGTLCCWVPGRIQQEGKLRMTHVEQVGEMLASMHLAAESFVPSKGFQRPRWDYDGLIGDSVMSSLLERLSPEQVASIQAGAKFIRRLFEELGSNSDHFGMIHGDFHNGNVSHHRGKPWAIDFEACGWGYFQYDLAATLRVLEEETADHLAADGLRDRFLESYSRVRPVPEMSDAMLAGLMAAHRLFLARYLVDRLDDPERGAYFRGFLDRVIQSLEQLAENR